MKNIELRRLAMKMIVQHYMWHAVNVYLSNSPLDEPYTFHATTMMASVFDRMSQAMKCSWAVEVA